MSLDKEIKISWTWEEWQASRKARREVTDCITAASVRRKQSSSDKRLRSAFDGERGPSFAGRKVAEQRTEYGKG